MRSLERTEELLEVGWRKLEAGQLQSELVHRPGDGVTGTIVPASALGTGA